MNINKKNGNDYYDDFVSFFMNNTVVPIVGTGLTSGVNTTLGRVPSGREYREYMINVLKQSGNLSDKDKEEIEHLKFSDLAGIYEDDDIIPYNYRYDYFKKNFYRAQYEKQDMRKLFFEIKWPYIYTLNIDDAIENSTLYKTIVVPGRDINGDIFDSEKCIIKLHGDISELIKYKDNFKVFTSKEYALSLAENRSLLTKLATDFGTLNVLFIGCSLEDEIDLLALDSLDHSVINGKKNKDENGNYIIQKKNILFSKGEPSLIQVSRYKHFGITDIAVFDDYEQMYKLLHRAWKDSQKLAEDDLNKFVNFVIKPLEAQDEQNFDYFFWAKNLIDYSSETIVIPHYMISRDILPTIVNDIEKYSIQVITGTRFSGKSYFLVDLYRALMDRTKYIFDARVKISDEALQKLLNKKNITILFDTEVLSRSQIELLFKSAKTMKENKISTIMLLQNLDTEIKGLLQLFKEDNYISESDYHLYDNLINNSLNNRENDRINKKLPEAGLTPYERNDTFVNHLMNESDNLNMESIYSRISIPNDTIKELAFSIAIASHEVLRYSDIVALEFEEIVCDVIVRCSPLIEMQRTKTFEKTRSDMSDVKYVLNSKFWIRKGLLSVSNSNKGATIIEAYRYLIERLIDFRKDDLNLRRNKYKKIIYFDTINDLFGGREGGNRDLGVQIYSNLKDLIGTDYQYNHQYAKCLMKSAYYQRDRNEKINKYSEAYKVAQIAWKQVNNEFVKSHNEKLQISLAHIEYSIASIEASNCDLNYYSDYERIVNALKSCYFAVVNPYNEDDFYRDKKRNLKYGIAYFVKQLIKRKEIISRFSKETKDQYDELLERIIR